MPKIILNIQKNEDIIAKDENIACYIVSDTLAETKIKEVVTTGKMVLVEGKSALDVCQKMGLDGVVMQVDTQKPLKVQIKPLREKLKKKTLGVLIPARRHEAMLVGETEPDFIAFELCEGEHDAEVINWYNELFLIPCAAVLPETGKLPNAFDVDFVIINAKKFENFGC